MSELPDPRTFLSGESGHVAGRKLTITRTVGDLACNAAGVLMRNGARLDKLVERTPARKVLVLGVYRPNSLLPSALEQLQSDKHEVEYAFGSTGVVDPALVTQTAATNLAGGKFQNLDHLLGLKPLSDHDWMIVTDDDVGLPPHFLDRFLAICEALSLDLAQPAQSRRSHSAWAVTRRRAWSLARRTDYVEIGPVTGFSRRAAGGLLPFPELRFGWGLDNHWGAIARERAWRLGVIDSLPVRHESQPVATAYKHAEAIAEARQFLAGKEYVTTEEAQRTLTVHRRLPSP